MAEYSKLLMNPDLPSTTPFDSIRREHNPLTTPRVLENIGYNIIDLFFYKFFAIPPLISLKDKPETYSDEYSKKLEIVHARAWWAHFNAHAFCIVGQITK
jgi:hypothetical protein